MSTSLTRAMLESAFAPEELLTVPQELLGPVSDADAAQVLSTLGIPHWENPWFDMDAGIVERLEPVAERVGQLSEYFAAVPAGADRWIGLGLFPYDDLAFDPATGEVFCLPEEGEIYRVNSSLRAFVHFHYLLKSTEPEWDPGRRGVAEREACALRLREEMTALDPTALEGSEACWAQVLTYVVDPEHHF